MFLHALVFFLLVTSVFAAPAGSKTKSRPEGHGSNHKVQEVETTPESHLGFWYPTDISNPSVRIANFQPSFCSISYVSQLVIEILRDKIRVRQLNQDGEVLPDPNPPVVSKDNDYLMADRGWRRLPQAYVSRLRHSNLFEVPHCFTAIDAILSTFRLLVHSCRAWGAYFL